MRVGPFRLGRGMIVLASTALALVACVDGTTPNCSDAASGCGPDLDGSITDATIDGGDATTDAPASGDGAPDAPADAPPADAPGIDAGNDAADAKAG